jgi:hypothetical protein
MTGHARMCTSGSSPVLEDLIRFEAEPSMRERFVDAFERFAILSGIARHA